MKFYATVPGMSLYPGGGTHWWAGITPEQVVESARTLERLGFDYLTIPEHVVIDPEIVGVMGPHWVHSLSATGLILGATSRIKVVCLVVVPYHHPVALAKALATLDYLSGGRLIVQALTGWSEWEFRALGVSYADRGRITDEVIDAMRVLWTEERPAFDGDFVSFPELVFEPKPVQRPLPVWMGGQTKRALRRIAESGDAWITYRTRRAQLPGLLDYLDEQWALQGRTGGYEVYMPLFENDRGDMGVVLEQPRVVLEPDVILQQVHELAALGTTVTDADTVIGTGVCQNGEPGAPPPTRSFDDYVERLHWFAETVLPEARAIEPGRLATTS